MKKILGLALAALLVVAFTMPAAALENEFGGYWRTRAYTQQNFKGEDRTEEQDLTQTDTRTRIYYTAKINDNLKLVNKFEMDAVFGGPKAGYGDIGADGVKVEVKNSYADFNIADWNFKVGVQGAALARGFLFNDDFAGAVIAYNAEGISVPLMWVKGYEGGIGEDKNEEDVDYLAIAPSFDLNEDFTITPYFMMVLSDDASTFASLGNYEEYTGWHLGFDFDAKFDGSSLWLTAIYQGGEADDMSTGVAVSKDISAWFAAIGGSVDLDAADVHAQVFYATGQDPEEEDLEAFIALPGQDHHWSEIMGGGIFDNQSPETATHYNNISDILAANLGAKFAPADKLKLAVDLWYAQLAEDNANGDKDLGTEVDVKLTYELVESLNLDLVGAYLFAGDATTLDDPDEADPYEVGARLSLSF